MDVDMYFRASSKTKVWKILFYFLVKIEENDFTKKNLKVSLDTRQTN